MSIRMCIVPTVATHSLLGGQYGEESEESEEGKEGQEEEEVTLPRDNDAIDRNVDAASQRPTRPKPNQRNAAAVATSALVDDGGRRRNRDSSFTDTVFWSGFTGRFKSWRACVAARRAGCEGGKSPRSQFLADALGRFLITLCASRAERRGFSFFGPPGSIAAQPPFRRVLHSL